MKLANAVSEIVRWRLDSSLFNTWETVDCAEIWIPMQVSRYSVTARSCIYWMNELTKINNKRFCLFFSAAALLQIAREMSRNGFSDEFLDVLSTLLQGTNFNPCCSVLPRCTTEHEKSEMVELLQKSAVEHLTTYRQLVARDFGSVVTIVTTDFEAMYAYKRGDYQRCLQLSTQNVHTLLYRRTRCLSSIPISLPEFVQLLNDDIVSLTALMLMVNRECRRNGYYTHITQLTVAVSDDSMSVEATSLSDLTG